MISAGIALAWVLPLPSTAAPSIGGLTSLLGQQQARQQSLAGSIGGLSRTISSLGGQISLVQSREAAVNADLVRDQAALAGVQASLVRERQIVAVMRARLARARFLLARQLVSGYEGQTPDLVGVVLDAHGFSDLLERVTFLRQAERQQQSTIAMARLAKEQADAAAQRLAGLEATDKEITDSVAVRVQALAGMSSLLEAKQASLQQAQAAQQDALAASRAKGAQLQGAIARAEQAARQGDGAGAPFSGVAGAGWVIPSSIVTCESGGQDLPPNGAGASGYYQIVPSTWKEYGGTGPAAYLASKSEQNAVASRIWSGGSGASNWACAGMVGL